MQFISSSYGTRPCPNYYPLNDVDRNAYYMIESVRDPLYAAHRPQHVTIAMVDEKHFLGMWTGPPTASLDVIPGIGISEAANIANVHQITFRDIRGPSDISVVVWHTTRRVCTFAFVHYRDQPGP